MTIPTTDVRFAAIELDELPYDLDGMQSTKDIELEEAYDAYLHPAPEDYPEDYE